jgi:hypothetical protein
MNAEVLAAALVRIRDARDAVAEGYEIKNGPGPDQCFDDWAADVADDALADAGWLRKDRAGNLLDQDKCMWAACEVCDGPADYDSEMCVCPACQDRE